MLQEPQVCQGRLRRGPGRSTQHLLSLLQMLPEKHRVNSGHRSFRSRGTVVNSAVERGMAARACRTRKSAWLPGSQLKKEEAVGSQGLDGCGPISQECLYRTLHAGGFRLTKRRYAGPEETISLPPDQKRTITVCNLFSNQKSRLMRLHVCSTQTGALYLSLFRKGSYSDRRRSQGLQQTPNRRQ